MHPRLKPDLRYLAFLPVRLSIVRLEILGEQNISVLLSVLCEKSFVYPSQCKCPDIANVGVGYLSPT